MALIRKAKVSPFNHSTRSILFLSSKRTPVNLGGTSTRWARDGEPVKLRIISKDGGVEAPTQPGTLNTK